MEKYCRSQNYASIDRKSHLLKKERLADLLINIVYKIPDPGAREIHPGERYGDTAGLLSIRSSIMHRRAQAEILENGVLAMKLPVADNYTNVLDRSIKQLFRDALTISLQRPLFAYFLLQTLLRQKKAVQKRLAQETQGIHVPPFMIASITKSCNLQCKGCYSRAHHQATAPDLTLERWHRLFYEAWDLGIEIILLAGGEPLVRREILEVTGNFPEIIFPLFTNGLLIDDSIIKMLKKQPNVIPVISLEGWTSDTDTRRGKGVFNQTEKVFRKLKDAHLFFGVSLMVTRGNFADITSDPFIKTLITAGCKLFFYVEYIPVEKDTAELTPTDEQRRRMIALMEEFRVKLPGLFVVFPGDEEKFGGCLSSGRGFIHVSPAGNTEPCPFAPYSDVNLANASLKEALQSKLLATIRENHEQLRETSGGCALWEKQEWVRSLLHFD